MNDRDLILYLDGLLDPDEAQTVAEALAASDELRARAALLGPTPIPTLSPPSPWRLPPPGAGWTLKTRTPLVMSATTTVRIGRRFQIHLPDVPDPEDRQVIVLRRDEDDAWAVLSPRSPNQQLPLSRLPPTDDGGWSIDLLASGPPGRQRWAIALPPRDLPLEWRAAEDIRWAGLQNLLHQGGCPVFSIDIDVLER